MPLSLNLGGFSLPLEDPTPAGGGISDAPSDGVIRGRKNGQWEEVQTGNPFDQSLNTTDSVTFASIYTPAPSTSSFDYVNLNTICIGNGAVLTNSGGNLQVGSNLVALSGAGLSQFWNDSNYISSGDYISSLTNDAGYITGNLFDQSLNTTDSPTFANGTFNNTVYGPNTPPEETDWPPHYWQINGDGSASFASITLWNGTNSGSLTTDGFNLYWNGTQIA